MSGMSRMRSVAGANKRREKSGAWVRTEKRGDGCGGGQARQGEASTSES